MKKVLFCSFLALTLAQCSLIRTETGFFKNGFLKEISGTWIVDSAIVTKRFGKPDTLVSSSLIGEITMAKCNPDKGEKCDLDNLRTDGTTINYTYQVGTSDKDLKEILIDFQPSLDPNKDISSGYKVTDIEDDSFTLISQNAIAFATQFVGSGLVLKLKRK